MTLRYAEIAEYPTQGLFTRHVQKAVIDRIDDSNELCWYAHGYVLGDDGTEHKNVWYVSRSFYNKQIIGLVYLAEADSPSGLDLFIEPPKISN